MTSEQTEGGKTTLNELFSEQVEIFEFVDGGVLDDMTEIERQILGDLRRGKRYNSAKAVKCVIRVGSTRRGYAAHGEYDLDYLVLVDYPKDKKIFIRVSESARVRRPERFDSKPIHQLVYNVNPEVIKNEIRAFMCGGSYVPGDLLSMLGALCYSSGGPRKGGKNPENISEIEKLRAYVRVVVEKYPAEARMKFLNAIVHEMVSNDLSKVSKMQDRTRVSTIPFVWSGSEEELQAFQEARSLVWRGRISRIYSLNLGQK